MNTHSLPALLCCFAAFSTSLAAQQFDQAIYGRGLNGTVALMQGSTSNSLTAAGAYLNPTLTTFAGTWNGTAWSPTLPTGASPTTGIGSWATAANGDILNGSSFTIQRWSTATGTWTAYAAAPSPTYAITEFQGTVLIGTAAGLFAWDTTTAAWVTFGTITGQPLTGTVLGLMQQGGALYAAGPQMQVPGTSGVQIASWNGAVWTAMPNPSTSANAHLERAVVLPNGTFFVSHFLSGTGGPNYELRQFDGTNWTLLARMDGLVLCAAQLPDGNAVVGGTFTNLAGSPTTGLARFDGSGFNTFATLQGFSGTTPVVHQLRLLDDDVLVAGGYFSTVDSINASCIAAFHAMVGGNSASIGTGCVGVGGLNTLTAINQPLIGKTFSSQATGMGAASFLYLTRSSTTIPGGLQLSTLFPSPPSCYGYVGPDYSEVIPGPFGPTFTLSFFVPPTVTLVGTVLNQQLLYFQPASSSLPNGEVTSTNGQGITFGRM